MTKETQTVWKDSNGQIILKEAQPDDPGTWKLECCYLTLERVADLRDALTDILNTAESLHLSLTKAIGETEKEGK